MSKIPGLSIFTAHWHLWLTAALTVLAWEYFMASRFDTLSNNIHESSSLLTIPSENPILRWEYQSNVLVHDQANDYLVQTNNFGFRDDDFSIARTSATARRIAFIGDSVTFGLFEDAENLFVSRIQSALRTGEAELMTETMNFGIDGYNTLQVSELLKREVIQFGPDEVLYIMCVNDFNLGPLEGDMQVFFDKPRSFTIQALQRIYQNISGEDVHLRDFERNKAQVLNSVTDMHELLNIYNISFKVVLIPAFYKDKNSFDEYPLERLHKEIMSELASREIHTIDLLPEFRNSGQPPHTLAHDIWHLNAAGHDIVARELVKTYRAYAPSHSSTGSK
ncbi:MAG: SGNH/GDSL hydrolase family protein [bacterium]